ncbi:hypothetical protein E4U21_005699 [Claviceps maximensis]|nr:hypothetical protein E4U21_005699 [Claviceps maximensis]
MSPVFCRKNEIDSSNVWCRESRGDARVQSNPGQPASETVRGVAYNRRGCGRTGAAVPQVSIVAVDASKTRWASAE